MEALYKEYGDEVAFFLVYIREAHPTDGWQVKSNVQQKILVTQPKTIDQRTDVASTMCTKLKLSMPTLIDGLKDDVNKSYNAWPDRLYLIGKDGTIVYKGGHGPSGFKPGELREAIEIETF